MNSSTTAWVAGALRDARERRNWTQGELAAKIGKTPTAISYWESGKRTPGLDDVLDLAAALEVDVNHFIPPQQARRPVNAVLRAAAHKLGSDTLQRVVEELIAAAAATDAPPQQIVVGANQPQTAANELLSKAGIEIWPVDVRYLAERCGALVLEHSFDRPNAPGEADDLSGLLFETDGGAVIGVNKHHHQNRKRFTIAHELGHFVLGHHRPGSGQRVHINGGAGSSYDPKHERAANDFAAELLMPRRLVAKAIETIASPAGLAREFEVSELAMGYRLINLGMR